MDSSITECKVTVSTVTGKEQQGQVKIQTWNKRDRLVRAAKVWGGCWGAMILSVFLPVAHFFLVPAFFLAGPIAGIFIYKQTSAVLGGESICPQCDKPLPLVRGPDKWPLDDMCSGCQTHVTIKKI